MRLLLIWLTVGLLGAWAQDSGLYIRNRPFQGAFEGLGQTMQVELKPLAEALDLTLRETPDGGLVAGAPPDPAASCAAGTVLVGGQAVPITNGKVELAAFCAAAGAQIKPNKALGTIDVYPGLTAGSGRASAPATVSPDATPTQVVQGFFAALRILEPLPPISDLLPFFRDPSRFVTSARLCEENLKPIMTAAAFQELGQNLKGMRSSLQKAAGQLRYAKGGSERGVQELQRDQQFVRFWGAVTRLWEGLRLADVTVLGEEINGERATVEAEITLGTLAKTTSKLELMREEGRWKLMDSPTPRQAAPRAPQPSVRTQPTPRSRTRSSTIYRPPLR